MYRFFRVLTISITACLCGTASGATPTDSLRSEWWTLFGSPCLNRLIQRSEQGNWQIAGALSRIESSKMALKGIRAGYSPQISVSAGWDAMRSSGRTTAHHVETSKVEYFNAGLDMSWEIDVFGRIAAQAKEGKASVSVATYDYDAALLSVKVSMAKAYFAWLYARERRQVAMGQLESQNRILKIAEVRKETGLSSGLDVAQAQTTVLTTKATMPSIDASERSAVNSMALLAGTRPAEILGLIDSVGADSILPPIPSLLPVNAVPDDKISSRPDVEAARAQIELCAAKLGIAKKEWLPVLTIDASIGTSATKISDLFSSGSYDWQVTPKLSWTLFDGMERRFSTLEAEYELQAAVDSYNETVVSAQTEVDNAVSQYECALQSLECSRQLLEEAEKTFELSLDLYKQGLADFTNVQDALVSCLDARNSILTARYDALTSLVTLFQALGIL